MKNGPAVSRGVFLILASFAGIIVSSCGGNNSSSENSSPGQLNPSATSGATQTPFLAACENIPNELTADFNQCWQFSQKANEIKDDIRGKEAAKMDCADKKGTFYDHYYS